MDDFDVVIVGASFSGLTLAHHLPRALKVLVIDSKPSPGFSVESTGLITLKTREEFGSFFPIDKYITNPITSICVIAPGFKDYFVSKTDHAWIFQTDTKALIKHLADTLPKNITLLSGASLTAVDKPGNVETVTILKDGKSQQVKTRFLVGADGGHSRVAQLNHLNRNKRFLIGYEKVFFGSVHLGPHPAETIYHFWFGEFSLGYGGWLSPTKFNGRPAFRIGLAKLEKDHKEKERLMDKFIKILIENGTITLDEEKPYYQFGSAIPIGGALKKVKRGNTLLIGDAAGLCGAFAADGIKGSVVSGKEGASLIEKFLHGQKNALAFYHKKINSHQRLMEYYARQVRYRWIWDQMKRDRTFRAMYDIIASERESFVQQFCDGQRLRKSLTRVVLKLRHLRKILKYSVFVLYDMLFS